jgi:hypothetical protein
VFSTAAFVNEDDIERAPDFKNNVGGNDNVVFEMLKIFEGKADNPSTRGSKIRR